MRIHRSAMLERCSCFRCRCPLCSACRKSGGGVCPDCYATGGGVGTAAGRMDCPDLGRQEVTPEEMGQVLEAPDGNDLGAGDELPSEQGDAQQSLDVEAQGPQGSGRGVVDDSPGGQGTDRIDPPAPAEEPRWQEISPEARREEAFSDSSRCLSGGEEEPRQHGRPRCQRCARRPGRLVACQGGCGKRVGPGCCLYQEFPLALCYDCASWEPEPENNRGGGVCMLGHVSRHKLGRIMKNTNPNRTTKLRVVCRDEKSSLKTPRSNPLPRAKARGCSQAFREPMPMAGNDEGSFSPVRSAGIMLFQVRRGPQGPASGCPDPRRSGANTTPFGSRNLAKPGLSLHSQPAGPLAPGNSAAQPSDAESQPSDWNRGPCGPNTGMVQERVLHPRATGVHDGMVDAAVPTLPHQF